MHRRSNAPGTRPSAVVAQRGIFLALSLLLGSSVLFLVINHPSAPSESATRSAHTSKLARSDAVPADLAGLEPATDVERARTEVSASPERARGGAIELPIASSLPSEPRTRIRVLDSRGTASAYPTIELWRERADAPFGSSEEHLSVRGDANGDYLLAGEWRRLGAVAWTSDATSEPIRCDTFTDEIEIVVQTANRVRGVVRDAVSGRPIESAEVRVWTHARSDVVTSASDGSYEHPRLPASGPRQQVRASAVGYASRIELVECDPLDGMNGHVESRSKERVLGRATDTWLEFELWPEAVIRGHVRGPDRMPIAGARVRAEGYVALTSESATPDAAETTTEDDGSFVLRGLRPDVAHALHVASLPYAAQLIELGADAVQELELQLELGAALEGVVVDPSGVPAEGLTIALWRLDAPVAAPAGPESVPARRLGRREQTSTDVAGAFAIEGLGAHRYELRVTRGSKVVLVTEVSPQAAERKQLLPLTLDARWLTLRGTVSSEDAAAPAGGGRVEISRGRVLGSVQVAGDGTFRVAGLDADEPYQLAWYSAERGGPRLASATSWAYEPVQMHATRMRR